MLYKVENIHCLISIDFHKENVKCVYFQISRDKKNIVQRSVP